MPFPYDEDKLPDTDWNQKPIVIVVGNPPNTERYKLLHRFLAAKVEANEIEVCWLERGEVSERVFVAPRNGLNGDGYQSHLYETLNLNLSKRVIWVFKDYWMIQIYLN